MDILKFLDEFENVVQSSARIPMTDKVIIHDEILYDYCDKFRRYLPQSILDAEYILKEKDRILNDAAKESEGLIEQAKLKCQRMAQETEIVKQALAQGEQIISSSKKEAKELKVGAYQYSENVLDSLQEELEAMLKQVRAGKEVIQAKKPENQVKIAQKSNSVIKSDR